MCPEEYPMTTSIFKESITEKLKDSEVPALFALLTSKPDDLKRWNPISIPDSVSDVSLRW